MTVDTRGELRALIDRLTDKDAGEALAYVRWLLSERDGPRYTAVTAPIDDEPETEEERAAVAEADSDLAAGRVVSHREIRREFGL